MVAIKDITNRNKQYYTDRSLVAVVIGGTSGIGEYAINALAQRYANQGSKLRLYFMGRNQSAAERIIARCRETCPEGDFTFIQVSDLSSIKEVDQASRVITGLEENEHAKEQPRIDLLIQTQGIVFFGGRQENKEGLDLSMSLIYYSRIRFVAQLMPLLEKAAQPAHVVSVFAAGLEAKLFQDDLGLRNEKNNNVINRRSHIAYMTTMAFERLAREYPNISFAHHFPGLVVTPAYSDPTYPIWFKLIWRLVRPIVSRFYAISPEDSGERTLFLGTDRFPAKTQAGSSSDISNGTDGAKGSGAYAVGQDSDVIPLKPEYKQLKKDGFEEAVWQHTMGALDDVEKTGRTTK